MHPAFTPGDATDILKRFSAIFQMNAVVTSKVEIKRLTCGGVLVVFSEPVASSEVR